MGDLVNSKPCNTCIYYMQLYGIKSVYYSNEDGEIVKEKINNITADHMSISQNKYYKYIDSGDKNIFDQRKEKEKIGKK
jgi:deoxycytidylate deaminase